MCADILHSSISKKEEQQDETRTTERSEDPHELLLQPDVDSSSSSLHTVSSSTSPAPSPPSPLQPVEDREGDQLQFLFKNTKFGWLNIKQTQYLENLRWKYQIYLCFYLICTRKNFYSSNESLLLISIQPSVYLLKSLIYLYFWSFCSAGASLCAERLQSDSLLAAAILSIPEDCEEHPSADESTAEQSEQSIREERQASVNQICRKEEEEQHSEQQTLQLVKEVRLQLCKHDPFSRICKHKITNVCDQKSN